MLIGFSLGREVDFTGTGICLCFTLFGARVFFMV